MKRCLLALLCAAGTTAGSWNSTLAQDAAAQDEPVTGAPQPEVVTSDWALHFTHGTPATVAIEQADGTIQWYWYMPYSVRNDTDESILFIPEIVIADNQGRVVHANRGVNARAFPTIKKNLQNDLLESAAQVPGDILPGEDYVKEGIAIWPVSEEDVDEFVIFFGGIYGETAPVLHPVTGEPMTAPVKDPATGEPMTDEQGNVIMEPVTVRRTRKIHYSTPGTTNNPQRRTIERVGEEDVMR